jgi:hypothetical protein
MGKICTNPLNCRKLNFLWTTLPGIVILKFIGVYTMKQKLLILTAAFVLCVFSVSCRSTLKYSESSSVVVNSPNAIIAGNFVSEKKLNEGDIVISGNLQQSPGSSFLIIAGPRYQWKGILASSTAVQPLSVIAWVNADESLKGLSLVSIKEFPDSFKCKDFNIMSSRPSFSKPETHNRLAEFTLNDKMFRVELYPQYRFQNMDDHVQLLNSKRQTVQIVDESGKVYADFDMNSYRIYEQPPDASVEQLQMAIAAFSVVQHINLKLLGPVIVL